MVNEKDKILCAKSVDISWAIVCTELVKDIAFN